jgi:hypothetical protein
MDAAGMACQVPSARARERIDPGTAMRRAPVSRFVKLVLAFLLIILLLSAVFSG